MNRHVVRKRIYPVFSILIVPLMAVGATAAPRPRPAEPAPIERMDSLRAGRMLDQIKTEVARVNNDADLLKSFYYSDLTWQSNAWTLDRIVDRVKTMDQKLYTLRTLQHEVGPVQSRTIRRVVPQMIVLTNELNDSIRFLNHNHNYLWSPTWREDTADLYRTSNTLCQDLSNVKREQEATLRVPPAPPFKLAS
jgi:hypothetical protein